MRALASGRLLWSAATLATAACVERMIAPGQCPEFCPSGSIQMVDTLLPTNVARDSAYRGYWEAHQARAMYVADVPGVVDSRAILVTSPFGPRVTLGGDTISDPIVASDSLRLSFAITRRDTAVHNLTIRFYRLSRNIDSTTTFADLAGPFAAAPLRTVNLDSLLAKTGGLDSATGDSISVDTATHRVTVRVKFDSLQARYVAADSGRLGIGVRVGADAPTSIALGTGEGGLAASGTWFVTVDSITPTDTTPVHHSYPASSTFDSFVFVPPAAPLDSTLAVGGVPSARSLLRVTLPRAIRDSAHIIRATLLLVPAVPARGAPVDSFVIGAHAVLSDFGAKSPTLDATPDTAVIRVGATDMVEIEVTNLLQSWASDTLAPTALMLRARDEGVNPAEIRFYPSAARAYAPALHVTYARRFPFGEP